MSYLGDHGINEESIKKYGLVETSGRVIFPIRDENGNKLYEKIRVLNPESSAKFIYNPSGNKPTIFNSQILKMHSEIIICEGEPDCIRLNQEGFPAVSATSGALTFKDDWVKFFDNKRIYICYDNDDAGKRGARKVAEKLLSGLNTQVFIVQLPDGVKDICDYFQLGNTKDNYQLLLQQSEKITLDDFPKNEKSENKKPTTRVSTEEQLLKLIDDSGVKLFHDQFNTAFVAPLGDGSLVFKIRSRSTKNWLVQMAWEKLKVVISSNSLQSIIQILEARACYDNPEINLSVRVGREANNIWFDLGRKAVKINKTGWEVVENPPILFRRFSHQTVQVDPQRGGTVKEILEYLNLDYDEGYQLSGDQLLILCWIVFGVIPDVPHPSPILNGGQGSKKTTFLKVLKSLIDPSSVETQRVTNKESEFIQIASHNWFLVLDNMTTLPVWLSDSICTIITGSGYSKRELFSDDDDVIYSFKHIVGINGINLVVERADLLERSLVLTLKRTSVFKSEKDFWSQYETRKPFILGGLFDCLVTALNLIEQIPEPFEGFRMVDFVHWGMAITKSLGLDSESFIRSYRENIGKQNQEALDASPVGSTLILFMGNLSSWKGTTSELLTKLEAIADQNKVDKNSKLWPKDARWLGRRITEVIPNLEAQGIKVSRERNDNRIISIHKVSKNDDNDVISTTPSSNQDLHDDNNDIISNQYTDEDLEELL